MNPSKQPNQTIQKHEAAVISGACGGDMKEAPAPIKISRLGDYIDDCDAFDVQEFGILHGESFFLHHGPVGKLRMPLGLQTTLISEGKGTTPDKPFNPQADFLVFPLRRVQAPTEDDDLIWIGRSENNDVVIPDASISAVHAFIKRGEENEFLIQDMNSKNGTYLNDDPVPAQGMGTAILFESGARIRLGSVSLTFLEVPEFHNLIKRLLLS